MAYTKISVEPIGAEVVVETTSGRLRITLSHQRDVTKGGWTAHANVYSRMERQGVKLFPTPEDAARHMLEVILEIAEHLRTVTI